MTPADEIRSAIASTDDALREAYNYSEEELDVIIAMQAERKRRLAQLEKEEGNEQER